VCVCGLSLSLCSLCVYPDFISLSLSLFLTGVSVTLLSSFVLSPPRTFSTT
jgi:hypothetical protein